MRKYRNLLIILATMALIVATFLIRQPNRGSAPRLPETQQSAQAGPPDILQPAARIEVEQAPKGTLTRREFLSSYWNDQWDEIEKAMLSAGIDLNVPYEPIPWELAEEQLAQNVPLSQVERESTARNILQWPEKTEAEMLVWIRSNFNVPSRLELTSTELRELEALVAPYNLELIQLAEEYIESANACYLQKWYQGNYLKAPFSTVGIPAEQGLSSKSSAAEGWSIVITLRREEFPDLASMKDRAASLRSQRSDRASEYFRSKLRR